MTKNEVAGELAQMAREPMLTERARFVLGLAKDMLRDSAEPECAQPPEHPAVDLLRQWLLAGTDWDDATWIRQVRDLVEDGTMPPSKSPAEPECSRADQWTPEEIARFQMQQAQNMCQGCFRPVSACVCASLKSEDSLREAIERLRAIKCEHGNSPLSCEQCHESIGAQNVAKLVAWGFHP
jgi:hypothetical protein